MEKHLPIGHLTLDVEDWEHANFSQLEGRSGEIVATVRTRAYQMDRNTDLWIEALGSAKATSTCFVLGEFARRYPAAVKRLAAAGHEIACHSDTHDLVRDMSQSEFHAALVRATGLLGELTGVRPVGFRAPSWSVDPKLTPWFCDELESAGYVYDSSEFPVKTPLFGNPDAPLKPYRVGRLIRVPVTVLDLGAGVRLPFASGAFFRLSPLPLLRWGLARAASKKLPVMIVLHPRELDPDHPRLPLQGWESAIHYARLKTTLPKLERLLPHYKWMTLQEWVIARSTELP